MNIVRHAINKKLFGGSGGGASGGGSSSPDRPLAFWFFTGLDQRIDVEEDEDWNQTYIYSDPKESVIVPSHAQDGSATSFTDMFASFTDDPYNFTMFKDGLWVKEICGVINAASATSLRSLFTSCSYTEKICDIINTGHVTNFSNMFYHCFALTSIPALDTKSATTMAYMFSNCTSLTSVPELDTRNVTDFSDMFSNCTSLTSVPELDTRNATTMAYMFNNCTSLTSVPELDTRNATTMANMFSSCTSLTSVPELDTRNATTMANMFYACRSLTSIPTLDARNATTIGNICNGCAALESVRVKNIKAAINFAYANNLTVDSLVGLCYELRKPGGNKTLTIGSTNLSKLNNVYVKTIDITAEMKAEYDLVYEKLPFVVCDSTDEGACLIRDYVTSKGWKVA